MMFATPPVMGAMVLDAGILLLAGLLLILVGAIIVCVVIARKMDPDTNGAVRVLLTVVAVILALVLAAAAIFAVPRLLGYQDIQTMLLPREIRMFNVIGMTEDQARQTLEQMGLKVEVYYSVSPIFPAGTVMTQTVPEGTQIRQGETVGLVVSQGKQGDSFHTVIIGPDGTIISGIQGVPGGEENTENPGTENTDPEKEPQPSTDNNPGSNPGNNTGTNPGTTTKPPQQTDPAYPGISVNDLIGSWAHVRRYEDTIDDVLEIHVYTFYADGTYTEEYRRYYDGPESNGWYNASYNNSVYSSTYRLDPLEGLYLEGDRKWYAVRIQNGYLGLNNNICYYPYTGDDFAQAALCGVDSTEMNEASFLFGTWSTAWREGDVIWIRSYTFNGDYTYYGVSKDYIHPLLSDSPGSENADDWFVSSADHPAFNGTFVGKGKGPQYVEVYNGTSGEDPDRLYNCGSYITIDGVAYYSGSDFYTICALCGVDTSVS